MASLTIRNLEETLKGRLRIRAASRGRSMEEEARQILRAALSESPPAGAGLDERIRRRFAALGDVQLPIASREAVREPPIVNEASVTRTQGVSKATRSAPPKRRG